MLVYINNTQEYEKLNFSKEEYVEQSSMRQLLKSVNRYSNNQPSDNLGSRLDDILEMNSKEQNEGLYMYLHNFSSKHQNASN